MKILCLYVRFSPAVQASHRLEFSFENLLGLVGCDTLNPIVPLKWIEYGVYGDPDCFLPTKPYSIYLRGTINPKL